MNQQDIFDMKAENKPQKAPLNPKAKKILVYILCGIIGILIAAAAIFAFDVIFAGAATPEEAVAEYQKAALLYDVGGMVEYSSKYNKVFLYGNRETSDRLLTAYLNKGYEGLTPKYTEDQIKFQLMSVLEYGPEEGKYTELMARYNEKIPNGSDEVDKIAVVKMTVISGSNTITRDFLAVKCGFRWFYGFTGF